MAIAIDATTAVTATNSSTTHTFSHTCTGSNLILWVAAGASAGDPSGVTYNGVAMTKVNSVNLQSSWVALWYLVAPATGANNVIVTAASGSVTGGAMSFTGAKQTGVPDSQAADSSQTIGVTSYSRSTTTVLDKCFTVASGRANGGATLTGGTNTTVTQPEVAALGNYMIRSTAQHTPAGTATLNVTSASQDFFSVIASFAPSQVDYTLALAQGSYALTGQTTGFSIGKTMVAVFGAYTLTGQDVTLTTFLRYIVNIAKNAISPTGQTKGTAISPTNQTKNTITPTNISKNQ